VGVSAVEVIPLSAREIPPLIPIASIKYKTMPSTIEAFIVRLLFIRTASAPNIKNRTGKFNIDSIIIYYLIRVLLFQKWKTKMLMQ
jgi:hypothetical protein